MDMIIENKLLLEYLVEVYFKCNISWLKTYKAVISYCIA